MPLYQQLILANPRTAKTALVDLFKKHTNIIHRNGGIVRGIENHGVRPLGDQTKKKYAQASTGERYFWDAQFMTSTFDCSPPVLKQLNRFLRDSEEVIRSHVTRVETKLDRLTSKTYKNPYKNA